MIHLLDRTAMPRQVQEMLEVYPILVKIVVDIRRRLLAGGGEMHAESRPRFSGHCEALLLAEGSEQDDLWGANFYPAEQRIEFESLINIRPRLGNRSIIIQNEDVRRQVAAITIWRNWRSGSVSMTPCRPGSARPWRKHARRSWPSAGARGCPIRPS